MKATESKAEVYLMALQYLSKTERRAVIDRLMDDEELRQDILDIAIIRQHQNESTKPFMDYLSDKKKRVRRE